ncbi:MAG: S8 family serine peptidase [Gaiellaceae bacterium]
MDVLGHGTFVSSIAAGSVRDGDGIAGFGGDTKLLVVQAIDRDGSDTDVDAAAAIVYAVKHGANVANLSIGGLTARQVAEVIKRSATGNGWTPELGWGSLNAGGAVALAEATPGKALRRASHSHRHWQKRWNRGRSCLKAGSQDRGEHHRVCDCRRSRAQQPPRDGDRRDGFRRLRRLHLGGGHDLPEDGRRLVPARRHRPQRQLRRPLRR